MMKITPRVALEVAAHEGLVREAYLDSTGVWTWSVGITSASGHHVERYIDRPQPMRKCLEVWLWLLDGYADEVREAFAGHDLSEAQFAAALSFHWNTGKIGKAAWVRHWKAGDEARAKRAFMNWRRPASIIPRRRAERDLFFDGRWAGDGKITVYRRVKRNGRPDFKSRERVDIRAEVAAMLDDQGAASRPSGAPGAPSFAGLLKAIIGALSAAFKGAKQ